MHSCDAKHICQATQSTTGNAVAREQKDATRQIWTINVQLKKKEH